MEEIIYDMVRVVCPHDTSIEMGNLSRSAAHSAVRGSLPGIHYLTNGPAPPFYPEDYDEPYRKIFYPRYSQDDYESFVPSSGNMKEDLATALVCAVAKKYVPFSDELDQSSIDATISDCNNKMRQIMCLPYAAIGRTVWKEFSALYQQIDWNDMEEARSLYRRYLIESAHDHAVWYASGTWTSPDYECFHHWTKFLAIGANTAEVDGLIQAVKEAGFPVPYVADVGQWKDWEGFGFQYMSMSTVEDEVKFGVEMSGPILVRPATVSTNPRYTYRNYLYSDEFTKLGEGRRYRR